MPRSRRDLGGVGWSRWVGSIARRHRDRKSDLGGTVEGFTEVGATPPHEAAPPPCVRLNDPLHIVVASLPSGWCCTTTIGSEAARTRANTQPDASGALTHQIDAVSSRRWVPTRPFYTGNPAYRRAAGPAQLVMTPLNLYLIALYNCLASALSPGKSNLKCPASVAV